MGRPLLRGSPGVPQSGSVFFVLALSTVLLPWLLCALPRSLRFSVQKGVIGIGQYFPLDGKPRALKIDVVCESGSKWVKVKAMNSKSIEDVYEGRGRSCCLLVVVHAAESSRCSVVAKEAARNAAQ